MLTSRPTALDVTVEAQILDLLSDLQARLGMAMIFISHDLNLVRRIAHRVIVMRAGEVVEEGPTARIFAAPTHAYTQMLIAAEPTGRKPPPPANAPIFSTRARSRSASPSAAASSAGRASSSAPSTAST